MKPTQSILALLFVLSANITAQVPNYVSTSSLVAWYPFSGNANDISGNNNHCTTFNSPVLQPDRFSNANSCYLLDGINDWINTNSNILNPSLPHTISIWWKTSDSAKVAQTLFNTNPHASQNLAFHYSSVNPTPPFGLSFGLGNGGAWSVMHPDIGQIVTPPNFNTWQHTVWVKGNAGLLIYHNGVLLTSYSTTLNPNVASANLRFGAENNGFPTGGANFKGYLDDIGVWNRTLSACEVYQLYTASLGSISATSSPTIICAGESVTLTASGSPTYAWSTNSNSASIIVNPSVTFTYSVTGCFGSTTVSVQVNPSPSLSIISTSAICIGQSATLTATGAPNYTWLPMNSNTNSIIVSPLANSSFTLLGTSAQNCTNQVSQNIAVNPNPTVSASGNFTICQGKSSTITATGGATYSLFPGAVAGNPFTVSPTTSTTYSVVGYNNFNCSDTAIVIGQVNQAPTITTSGPSVICIGESALLQANGALSYSWQTGQTTSTVLVNPVSNFTYNVTGTNSVGCAASNFFELNVSECLSTKQIDNSDIAPEVYPNPSQGQFYISNTEFNSLLITDHLGRSVNFIYNKLEGTLNFIEPIPGIYTIQIYSNSGNLFIKRVLVGD